MPVEKLLPKGTVNLNDPNFVTPSYSNCTFFEGLFVISIEEYVLIADEHNSLRPGRYSYIVNKKFEQVNNTCKLYFKEPFFSERKKQITVYCYCIHRKCKN